MNKHRTYLFLTCEAVGGIPAFDGVARVLLGGIGEVLALGFCDTLDDGVEKSQFKLPLSKRKAPTAYPC